MPEEKERRKEEIKELEFTWFSGSKHDRDMDKVVDRLNRVIRAVNRIEGG